MGCMQVASHQQFQVRLRWKRDGFKITCKFREIWLPFCCEQREVSAACLQGQGSPTGRTHGPDKSPDFYGWHRGGRVTAALPLKDGSAAAGRLGTWRAATALLRLWKHSERHHYHSLHSQLGQYIYCWCGFDRFRRGELNAARTVQLVQLVIVILRRKCFLWCYNLNSNAPYVSACDYFLPCLISCKITVGSAVNTFSTWADELWFASFHQFLAACSRFSFDRFCYAKEADSVLRALVCEQDKSSFSRVAEVPQAKRNQRCHPTVLWLQQM